MAKIELPKEIRAKASNPSIKDVTAKCEIHGDKLFITDEKGKTRMESILNVSPAGIYTSDDKFYSWNMFEEK